MARAVEDNSALWAEKLSPACRLTAFIKGVRYRALATPTAFVAVIQHTDCVAVEDREEVDREANLSERLHLVLGLWWNRLV